MKKTYYLLCVGENWNRVACNTAGKNYIEEKDTYDYDTIYLKKVKSGTITEYGRSLFKGRYSVSVPAIVDSPIYVERIDNYLEDIVTGTKFPMYSASENEKVLFHGCYSSNEKRVADFLRSLTPEDIQRYKVAMLELKKAIDKANVEIINEQAKDSDYIKEFKKKYR